ncbi:T9SS type A sorting domain-containing protein [Aquimarina sp. U1-2]|uniref:DUF5689 domain-containing protein n=1 Tax=Aquimarina sp. U1-2 TaxID=2823141 RepID=UPI001AED0F16|nr:DUF5689 domain-containing protein [Aquimarina sp. U1-2]MBP2831129.1 T9SS type A sorting domain-containing protein [Aquimarina sp. U1-2]
MKLKLLLIPFSFLCFIGIQKGFTQSVFINEIHYDNVGADVDEAIEIVGPAGTDLTNWSIVLYNGSNQTAYNTVSISGILPDQQNGFGTIAIFPAGSIQNGAPDGIALVDNTNTVIQFLSYEGVFTAANGPAAGQTSTDIGVSESSSTPAGNSLQLSGTGSLASDFTWQVASSNTYGAINTNQTFGAIVVRPLINEFVLNHTGADTNEFIEVLAASEADLSEYWLLEIDGDSNAAGTIDQAIQLGTADTNGYYTTPFANNSYENGTLSLLLVKNFTGTLDQDLDTDDNGVFERTPWEELLDDVGVNDADTADINYAEVTLLSSFDGIPFTVGGASRFPNGKDTDATTDWIRNDFNGSGLPSFPDVTADPGEAVNTPNQKNQVANDGGSPVTSLLINEIDADTQGSDTLEFVELYDGGIGNTSLEGFVLVNYNGSNNASYSAIDLDGFSTDAGGYFVIGNADVANVDLIVPGNSFQNGADAVVLYVDDASSFPNGTAISTENIVDAIVYDTDDSDNIVLLTLLNANQPQLNENQNGDKDAASLQRIPNGQGGARNTTSYVAKAPTPGISNEGVLVVPGETVTIAEARAAAEGTAVTIAGVLTVTNSFNGPAFIQDATGGIAVFDEQVQANAALQVGDSITLTGVRAVFNDQVQITGVVEVIDNGRPQRPILPQIITLSEIESHPGELVQVTNTTFPNPGDLLFGNSNVTLTDASGAGELRIDNDVASVVGKVQPTTCPSITGVVGRFREFFQLLPRDLNDIPCTVDFIPPGDTIGIPKEDTFDVVTWNIEWFGDENNSPVGQNPMSDAIQRDSTATVLQRLNSDIYAVQEIADDALLEELVAQLPGYDYVLSDAFSNPGGTPPFQKIGFIYNTETVSVVSTRAMFTSIHPLYNGGDDSALVNYPDETSRFFASGRLPFLLTADVTVNGVTERIDLIALHARANNSRNPQNRYNMRKYDVEVLKDSLDAHFANNKVVLLGDYNDDVDETVADISSTISSFQEYVDDTANYTIVSSALSEAGLRSFVFRENMIDHITITNELDEAYIENSVTVHYEIYDADYAFTTSDHFPVSARFLLEQPFRENSCTGASIVSFEQGKRKDGRKISRFRSNPHRALGTPNERKYFDFVSLGFGGAITIALNEKIFDNKNTNEFAVFESTGFFDNIPCQYFPETAEVFASADGVEFASLGTTCQDGEFDLADGNLDTAKYIKIVDVSDRNVFPWFADGFDLDAIVCLENGENLFTKRAITALHTPTAFDSELLKEDFESGDVHIAIAPNPVIEQLFLDFQVLSKSDVEVIITDITGKTVYQQAVRLAVGSSRFSVDMRKFPRGFYVVRASDEKGTFRTTKKILKN